MASSRSRPLPCGTPSTTSTSTTSASSLAAIQCAAVAPTLPAPITLTFFRMLFLLLFNKVVNSVFCYTHVLHVADDARGKLAGAHFRCAGQLPLEVVRHEFLQDG